MPQGMTWEEYADEQDREAGRRPAGTYHIPPRRLKRYVIQIQNIWGDWLVSATGNGGALGERRLGFDTVREAIRETPKHRGGPKRVYDRKNHRPVTRGDGQTLLRRE